MKSPDAALEEREVCSIEAKVLKGRGERHQDANRVLL